MDTSYSNPLPPREDLIRAMEEEEHDVLIIGGGATGCGVALDSVSRGINKNLNFKRFI